MNHITLTAMPAAGHVNPTVPLVRELVRRKIAVSYYATEEFRGPVERLGAEFRPYPAGAISPTMIAEATRHGGPVEVVTRVLDATHALVPFLIDDLRDRPPAAMAFDSNALWGRMAAASLGLPMISLMTTMLLGADGLRSLGARELISFVGESVAGIPGTVAARQRMVRRFGTGSLPPRPIFPMRGDLTLFPIPEWMQGSDSRLDRTCHFVGPTIEPASGTDDHDADLTDLLATAEPLVLVSLGTLHTGSEAFFRSCFEAFADLPARVLLSVGTEIDPARLGRPSANTLVRSSVPQLRVLERASVFVTHGGMNSALEGLHFGVPLVVVPQQFEQMIIGRAVAERGAGVVLRQHLSHRAVPPAELRAAVDDCLADPTRRAAARTLGKSLPAGGGAVAAADLIDELVAGRTPAAGPTLP
ncbi:nucleotide disphospho-sugar-binding domain-containing protein [Microlunatus speluncae]|uniref:nucleotide disphospho-sugar-binding domain-containing protein n=1 Tax=Microlunatus speluncae TaxID=2594267 RepID=UPI001C2D1252|nr:nucleotide disphospho-sugar-binding domain-containing protein [Microlunatus speluncae]